MSAKMTRLASRGHVFGLGGFLAGDKAMDLALLPPEHSVAVVDEQSGLFEWMCIVGEVAEEVPGLAVGGELPEVAKESQGLLKGVVL